jgi:hypothetical protein
MKMPWFRNISISQIPATPDRSYKQVFLTYIIITYLYSLNVQLFTNEDDLLRKLINKQWVLKITTNMIILSNSINLIGMGSFLLGLGGFDDGSFSLKYQVSFSLRAQVL